MSDKPTLELHNDGRDIFVIVDGVRIAKRAIPVTALAMTWIMLEPGWVIRDIRQGNAIEVRYEGARIH
jgi:archaellum component FlaG (FlaF/FlaG flagellin family)